MSADLIARLIASGTPAALVAEVACALGRLEAERDAAATADRRSAAAIKQQRYRQRGGGQVPGWLRLEIFERDGHMCVDCGSEDRLEIDHVIPLAKGGHPTDADNLQTLCRPCNARKRDRIRKQDERGQSRKISDNVGIGGSWTDGADTAPFLDKEMSPRPPKEINPIPGVMLAPVREGELGLDDARRLARQQPRVEGWAAAASVEPEPAPAKPKRRAAGAGAFAMPEGKGIDPQHWADLLVNRKSKRLPNTATAYARMLADLDRLSDEEWPPGRLVQFAAERGWGAIFDPRNRDTRNGTPPRHHQPSAGARRFRDPLLQSDFEAGRFDTGMA